jgi:ABC-type glycerol-3-phosphate transport system substrate-binding protein
VVVKHTRIKARSATVALGSILTLVMASACSSSGGKANSSGGSLTILADTTREPAIQAFEKANPTIKVTIQTYANTGNDGLEQKFALYNKAGSGWPDVVFLGGYDLSWAEGGQINYAADISHIVPSSIQSGYSPNVLATCKQGSKLVCLPNDLGQTVLWYNAKLFTQWGYTAPTTWQDYEALSLQIAKQHPGYYTGLAGDVNVPSRYLMPSGCPTSQLTDTMKVTIDLAASSCTRVQNMLSTLLAAKVVSPEGLFDTDAAANVGAKLVMTPGASWYGQFIFEQAFKVPPGEITASAPLQWAGEQSGTGDEGGGLWVASRHDSGQRLANAVNGVTFLSSNVPLQTTNVTFPAYGPAQQPWLDAQGVSGYFADYSQLSSALKQGATEIRTDTNYVQYNPGDIWSQTVTAALAKGSPLSSGWSSFATQLVQQAKSVGYSVTG